MDITGCVVLLAFQLTCGEPHACQRNGRWLYVWNEGPACETQIVVPVRRSKGRVFKHFRWLLAHPEAPRKSWRRDPVLR